VVFDVKKDGFCCEFGQGSWSLYFGSNKDGNIIANGSGDIGDFVQQQLQPLNHMVWSP
jgi:hypothetical protein